MITNKSNFLQRVNFNPQSNLAINKYMTRKLKKNVPSTGTFYDEAYRLIFGAASKTVESEIKKTKRTAEEIELGTKETEESIARGARRTKHRFRI